MSKLFNFNAVVSNLETLLTHEVSKLPITYNVSLSAPDKFKMVENQVNLGHLTIYSEGCEKTIFSCPHYNHIFRLLHDFEHVRHRKEFTPEDEIELAKIQAYKANDKLLSDLILVEVKSQVEYLLKYGYFVENQRDFAINELKSLGYTVFNY